MRSSHLFEGGAASFFGADLDSMDNWKKIQENTFTKWVNSSLNGHLTTNKNRVTCLENDLEDGIILAELLENISKDKLCYVKDAKKLKIKPQKLENLGVSFRFMNDNEIKLVNIGPADIYNGNLKLILGLIWTLIRRYQICSTGRALSTKASMLAWITTQIPDQMIKNFTTDWNDGVALCALVDKIRPGIVPHHSTLSRSNKKGNCTLGMSIAQEKLGIPPIMDADDLCHRDVDENSIMTYISYFCKPANTHLLYWVQATIPKQNITNFTTDWNNGINLACLLEALNPKGFPNWSQLDPQNARDNLAHGMKVAKDQLGIDPILTPCQMSDSSVDELNIITYLSRFQNAKPLPQPQEVTCTGEGLTKAIVGESARFEVDTSRGGMGDLIVAIDCSGKPVNVDLKPNSKGSALFLVKYVPESVGLITITIRWSGTEILSSPYSINVIDPKTFSLSAKQITGGECAKVGQTVKMEVKGFTKVSEVEVKVELSSMQTEQAKVVLISHGLAECSYTPYRVGVNKVMAKIAGIDIPGSPFKIKVIDTNKMSVTLRDLVIGKPLLVNNKATVIISATEGGMEGVMAELKTPKGTQEISLTSNGSCSSLGAISPVFVGKHEIRVTYAGDNIKGSPIILDVFDPSKCTFQDSLPKFLHVGKPCSVCLKVQDAGEGSLQIESSEFGILAADARKIPSENIYSINLTPKQVGDALLNVSWNGVDIPHSPHKVFVCDASKCSAFGPGLTSGNGKVKDVFELIVQVKGAGNGELCVTPMGPKSVYVAEIKKNPDGTFKVNFTSFELGEHKIEITWSGKAIPNSPYYVNFIKAAAANTFTVTGDGLKNAIALSPASFMLIGPESGLLSSGMLKVSLSGMGLKSTTVSSKAEFNSLREKALVHATDKGNGAYLVEYSMPKAGKYYLSITSDNEHIPGSAFTVEILPPPNAEKCKIFGPAIDDPSLLVTVKPVEFKVDSTNAGTGELTVKAKGKDSKYIPVFIAEDKSQADKKIHSIKIDFKTQGTYEVAVQWNGKVIPKTPLRLDINDPKSVIIIDFPDSLDYVGHKGDELSFSVDSRKAGNKEEIKAVARLENGNIEPFQKNENLDGTTKLSFAPLQEGRMEVILTFCGISLLPSPWFCDVTDPSPDKVDESKIKVKPPPGIYGRINERVTFGITGVTDESELSITSVHPEHQLSVQLESEPDSSSILAYFTPEQIGDYSVEMRHAGQQIDGSPFIAQIVNPDACMIIGKLKTIIHVGETPNFKVDVSKAGPGELIFETEIISGIKHITHTKKICDSSWLVAMEERVGKFRLFIKWAGYDIQGSPFILSIVDSQKVNWSCAILDKVVILKQGQLIEIILDCYAAGDGQPEIIAIGPEAIYPAMIKENEDETFTISLTPWQTGRNEVKILWGGQLIPNTPISFEVIKNIEARTITASGDGLEKAIANSQSSITINGIEAGLVERGLLKAHFGTNEENHPSVELKDKGDGLYILNFTALRQGTYSLVIMYAEENILNSPFIIPIHAAPDSAKCKVLGEAIEKDPAIFVTNDPVKFTIDTIEAGTGSLAVSASQPNGETIRVYAVEEEGLHHLKFDPDIIGHYKVTVMWDRQDISGSPFDFNVVDPMQCQVSGIPSDSSFVHAKEQLTFSVDTKNVGECTPSFTIDSHGFVFYLESTADSDLSEGIFKYVYEPDTAGKMLLIIKIAGMHVPGSPFSLTVVDSNHLSISGLNITGDYAIVCEPVQIDVFGSKSDDEDLLVIAHGPSADLNVDVAEKVGMGYVASFVPIEPGSYELFVEFAGRHVRGSPFTIKVADPSKCLILGEPLSVLQLGESEDVIVKTRGAGEGKLEALLRNMDEFNLALDLEVKNLGLDTYSVTFIGKSIGNTTIDLQWGGFTIPSCPFIISVCDATKCKASGEILTSRMGKAGSLISFSVDTAGAGEAQLEVVAKGPSAQYTMNIKKTEEYKYRISFTPWEIGDHKLDVLWGRSHITGSPFSIIAGSPLEMEVCSATGDGLKHAIAGQKATFTIISNEVGLVDKGILKVMVMGITAHAEVTITDNKNGCYTVDYTPPSPGAFIVSILFHDHQIQGSPFKLTVDDGPDASECKAYGPALHHNTIAIAGSPLEFFVETAEAGYGQLKVYVQGPNDYRPKVFFMASDKLGVYSIKFDAMKAGKYYVVVLWSDKHIPNSPFRIRVHPAADASKVRAFGSGLLDGFIGTPGRFTIETKDAGIGTLLIRVHGLKDSFKIEAQPVSIEDTRTLVAAYNPKLVAEYTIFVRWSGVHVPGSPFTVNIKQKPGSHDPAAEPTRLKFKSSLSSAVKKVIDAKTAPPHSDVQGKKGEKRKHPHSSSSLMKKVPPVYVDGVGPIGPSLVMKDNPAMTMALAQSLPPDSKQGGYVSGVIKEEGMEYTGQKEALSKKQKDVVRKVVVHKKRSSSSDMHSRPHEAQGASHRALSPSVARSEAVRRSRTTSPPVMQPSTSTTQASPIVASPTSKPVRKRRSSEQAGQSPTRKSTSPAHRSTNNATKGSSSRALSPASKDGTSAPMGASPVSKTEAPVTSPAHKATSPARKATSPARKAGSSPRRVKSPPPKTASQSGGVKIPSHRVTSPAPKGHPKKKADPSRTKSPPRRLTRGRSPPPKKAAKQRK